jgi:phosphatidylserine decarboxylase
LFGFNLQDRLKIKKHGDIPVFKGKDVLRIGIFLSVLDVHVNRAPCKMNVEYKFYKEGKFHDARNPMASKENESMMIAGTGRLAEDGFTFPLAVRQISGAIARRIVCPVSPGCSLEKGDKYGMIKFGSRTELYLPAGAGFEAAVNIGDKVYGGTTIIAKYVENNKK